MVCIHPTVPQRRLGTTGASLSLARMLGASGQEGDRRTLSCSEPVTMPWADCPWHPGTPWPLWPVACGVGTGGAGGEACHEPLLGQGMRWAHLLGAPGLWLQWTQGQVWCELVRGSWETLKQEVWGRKSHTGAQVQSPAMSLPYRLPRPYHLYPHPYSAPHLLSSALPTPCGQTHLLGAAPLL